MDDDNKTSFGFKSVGEGQKQSLVNEVFSSVAGRYDQMNDLMSAGVHRLWKDDLVTWLNPPKHRPFRVLDVAGGTGDIASRIVKAGGAQCDVMVADISADMIAEGHKRARAERLDKRCHFCVADAQALAFPDQSFDAYTIAFGIRNVPDIGLALREAYRVLRPGGRFLCLEFSHVTVPGLKSLYDAYSFAAIPAMGQVVSGDGAAYRYLVESIRKFPNQDVFLDMISNAGFSRCQYRNLSGGIVAIHSAWRL